MTIEYALTRTEILVSYFRSLAASRRFLATILLYSLSIGVMVLAINGAFSRTLTSADIVRSLAYSFGFLLFLPIMLFIRGKTSTRTLTISPEGISTRIGSIKGEISWRDVRIIAEREQFILIGRSNGNALFIPCRAFSGPEQKARFLTYIRIWTGNYS